VNLYTTGRNADMQTDLDYAMAQGSHSVHDTFTMALVNCCWWHSP